jgi:peptidylprolyl isomerase
MTNVKHIAFALLGSITLLIILGLWIGYKTGEVQGLSSSKGEYSEEIPGPLSVTKQSGGEQNAQVTSNSIQGPINTMTAENTPGKNPIAVFHTNYGDIALELYADAMPVTVGNFVKLATEGYYDNTKFHRVIQGFMIQGGDSNSKGDDTSIYGRGGPGYTIADEFVADPRLTNVRGTIAMANTGQPNSGGSQFFINLVDNVGLDYDKPPQGSSHPVFGKVVEGLDVVDTIGAVETQGANLPVKPVIITNIEIQ